VSEHPVLALIRGKLADPSRSFTIIADMEAHAGRGDEIVARIAASQVIRLTRAEPGCLSYDLLRDADFPDRFVAYECWSDLAALQNHLATPHFAAVGESLAGLLAAAPEIRVLISTEGRDTNEQPR
jgi:quinol monooxygenase YgiN